MKEPIWWHQECLANRMYALRREREQIDQMELLYQRNLSKAEQYSNMIQRAIDEGRDGFDIEKYGKKNKKRLES